MPDEVDPFEFVLEQVLALRLAVEQLGGAVLPLPQHTRFKQPDAPRWIEEQEARNLVVREIADVRSEASADVQNRLAWLNATVAETVNERIDEILDNLEGIARAEPGQSVIRMVRDGRGKAIGAVVIDGEIVKLDRS